MRRVLISVSDKTDIDQLASGLVDYDYEIISTGGTAKFLREQGLKVKDVSEVTLYPEMMDGRVKTLHPAIHGGLLALRDNSEHMEQLEEMGILPIDMVVVNLYPFAQTIAKKDVTLEEAIENIDIGGPTMIRSAAKNYLDVAVITDPADYGQILSELNEKDGQLSQETRRSLAVKAFKLTGEYDQMIYDYLSGIEGEKKDFPGIFKINYSKKMDLRYGENPHQKAAFYIDQTINEPSVATAEQLSGKELSFNNINDTDGALELVKEFSEPTVAVIKHTNPCGLASAENLLTAYERAYSGDPLSAYGSIVALNRKVDYKTAQAITGPDKFVEVIIAPAYEERALKVLRGRWESIRILKIPDLASEYKKDPYEYKKITGGLLVQERNMLSYDRGKLKVVTRCEPDEKQWEDLLFAWKGVKHVKSNAVVIARDKTIVGVGAGQMSRVDSMLIAIRKSGNRVKEAVVASDAFFPFRDAIDEAAASGIKAIIQPGGSVRDEEVIEAADEHNIAMVLTGNRHFKH